MSDKTQQKSNNPPINNNNDRFSELRNRFSKKKNSEYPIQKQCYIREDIDNKIKEFERILESEVELSNKLDDNAETKIKDASDFFNDNKDLIEEQFDKLCSLENDICSIMDENKQKQELDKNYNELVNKEEYKNLASKIKKLNSKIQNLDFFLVKSGVKDY